MGNYTHDPKQNPASWEGSNSESYLNEAIREMLKTCANDLTAPARLDTRIQFALNQPKPRRRKWFKRAIATLAVASLAVTGAWAGGRAFSVSSHTYRDKAWKDFDQTASYAEQIEGNVKYLESFTNGYTFQEGNTQTSRINDADDNIISTFTDLFLMYGKDGNDLFFEVGPVQEDLEYISPFDKVREINGVEVRYREMFNIFLPPDGSVKPTEEEQAKADAGEINIGYGSDTREEKTYYTVKWIEGDLAYDISAFDVTDLTEDDFFQMASEVIAATAANTDDTDSAAGVTVMVNAAE